MSKITNPITEQSVTCGFFNSVLTTNAEGVKVSDRRYNAEQMSAIFDGLINDGVFASIGDKFIVKASSGNTVNVGTGKCWFNHTWTLNDSILPIDCGTPPINLKRIDAIVVEVNTSPDKRDNFIKIIKGTEASTPNKPTLTKGSLVNQHALCYITRRPGASISQSDIENAVGTSETPFVTGIVQVTSLDDLLGQWSQELDDFIAAGETKLDEFIAAEETDFNDWYAEMKRLMADVTVELNDWTVAEKNKIMTWFNEVKGQLSEDPALNLQLQIDANEVERLLLEGLPDGTKTFSEDGTVIVSTDSKGRTLTKTFTNNFLTITSVLKSSINNEYLVYPYSAVESGQTVTISGITFTDNGDRTITANGTSTADTWLILSSSTFALPPGLYSISGCPTGGSDSTYYYGVSLLNESTYVSGVSDYGNGVVLDTENKIYTESRVFIRIRSGVTVNNLVFNPKVVSNGATLGILVKEISTDGKTIESTITNYSDTVPNLVEIERAVDTIIANENTYIGGDNT